MFITKLRSLKRPDVTYLLTVHKSYSQPGSEYTLSIQSSLRGKRKIYCHNSKQYKLETKLHVSGVVRNINRSQPRMLHSKSHILSSTNNDIPQYWQKRTTFCSFFGFKLQPLLWFLRFVISVFFATVLTNPTFNDGSV